MVFGSVDRLVARTNQEDVVYECRRCGISVDNETEICPACGADAIVQHWTS